MNIDKLDSNFKTVTHAGYDIRLFDIEDSPFAIYGLIKEADGFVRMPSEAARAVGEGIYQLSRNTSGGRVRFKTDSSIVVLKCEMPYMNMMLSMPFSGSVGFDLYADGEYVKSFTPTGADIKKHIIKEAETGENGLFEYSSTIKLEGKKMRDITINFPPYNGVNKLYIGIEAEADLAKADRYSIEKPVVFYGSSITQGGCVSRPGNVYSAVLSRKYDFDFLNLGFSGNAKGEAEIARYIAGLDMSAFVYDYDCNAPDTDFYRDTHYAMYKIIRDKNPSLPIIMATRPSVCGPDKEIADGFTAAEIVERRIAVAKGTLERARAEGDKNIYLISGMDMMNLYDREMMTVDGCHPNDFGSFCMAKAFGDILKNVLL